MNLPQSYYTVFEMKYRELMGEQKKLAQAAKERLLSFKPNLMQGPAKKNIITNYELELAIEISIYFNNAVFFHDDQALNKLKEFKLPADVLRWFVSLSEIQDQFELIRKHNIGIDTFYAITQIKNYLNSKFKNELTMHFQAVKHDNVTMSPLSKEIIKTKQKIKSYGPELESKKNNFETIINSQINKGAKVFESLEVPNKKSGIKTFYQFSRGNTESLFLRIVVEDCFYYDEKTMTKTKFLSIIYDLLSLLIQDRVFITEDQFINSHKRIYQSYKNFDAYKAKKIRFILFK